MLIDEYSRPPSAVFIRAKEIVVSEKLVEVDWFRDEACLGWKERYPYNFIRKEFLIDGDHFSIFSPTFVSCLRFMCLVQLLT